MNHIYNVTILLMIIGFLVYVLKTQKKIRVLTETNKALQKISIDLIKEQKTLSDQYRQLANINKALTDIRPKIRNYKKK